jgi:hypothetical protein
MVLILGNTFEQAVFHAYIFRNDAIYLMVGLITQAIENRPFSRIKRLAKKVIEEDNGL